MARDLFTNQASTTVAASKTAPAAGTTESWTVASSSAFPAASNAAVPATQFYIADPAAPTELILVTNVSGTTWSVTRGADGTTPVTHSAGFTVKNVVPATWLQRIDNRFKQEEYNVLDFGAVGDDSTDNYDAFQDALNAARDNGGGIIRIPKGDYRFETTPFKIYEGTHIIAHPQAHIKNYAGTAASMFWNGTGGDAPTGYAGNGNITIEGGIWDQRGSEVGGAACFSFAHGKNLTWRDVTIRDVRGTHAIEVNGCQTVRIVNCTFEGFYDPDGTREYSEAVQLDLMKSSSVYGAFGAYDHTTCDDVLVDGCTFTTSESASAHEWGRGVGSHNGTIGKWHTNIRVTNNYFNVKHEAVRTYAWNRFTIANNVVVDGSTGFTLQSNVYNGSPNEDTKDTSGTQTSGSQPFEDFTITGNVLYGSQSGETNQPLIFVNCEDTGQAFNGSITGNTITSCGDHGIEVTYGNNITVANNIVEDAGDRGIWLEQSDNINVSGNTLTNGNNVGITATGSCTNLNLVGNLVKSSSGYGIVIGSCDDVTIANNKIQDAGSNGAGAFTVARLHFTGNTITNPSGHGLYTSFCTDSLVDGNFIFGANAGAGSNNAFHNDSGASTITFTNNMARVGASSYVRAMNLGSGTGGTSIYCIKNNDLEAGSSGRMSLSGTIQGMTAHSVFWDTIPASGTNFNQACEWVAPTSGYLKRMQCRLGSGSCTIKLTHNDTEAGTSIAASATATNGANQTIEYAAGDRFGLHRDNTGSSPASGISATFWVIENGSDL